MNSTLCFGLGASIVNIMAEIDPAELRVFVYDVIVSRGLPPTSSDIGEHFRVPAETARAELAALKIGKTILLNPKSAEIWMAGPFSSAQTDYRLTDGTQTWWANCAWDMLGIPMILGRRVTAHTVCTDCRAPMAIECDPSAPPVDSAVVHFLVPARRWYDDIGFT
jgi:hypothetical protein